MVAGKLLLYAQEGGGALNGQEAVYAHSPEWLQTLLVSGFGLRLLAIRGGPSYWRAKAFYRASAGWSRSELEAYQIRRLQDFIVRARRESPFYRRHLGEVRLERLGDLEGIPVLEKETLRRHLDEIRTIRRGVVVHTGGTTGKPLEVLFRRSDMQERMAWLDAWREAHGVRPWGRRATFSGRIIIPPNLERPRTFARTNLALRQRLYSTFHLHERNLDAYLDDLEAFQPETIDGFPSAIATVASHALAKGRPLDLPLRGIFVTSENLYEHQRELMEEAFRCPVRNQYASAEGAPFVLECPLGRLHYDLRTGVIEGGDAGILVTSFTTSGTPLIRYRIGDQMDVTGGSCGCGNQNPVIRAILGRDQDYVVSPERGMVGVGLIDIFKKIPPVVKQAQIVQDEADRLVVRLVVDRARFEPGYVDTLRQGLIERVGLRMGLAFELVDRIEPEAGGKIRYIKRAPHIRWSAAARAALDPSPR